MNIGNLVGGVPESDSQVKNQNKNTAIDVKTETQSSSITTTIGAILDPAYNPKESTSESDTNSSQDGPAANFLKFFASIILVSALILGSLYLFSYLSRKSYAKKYRESQMRHNPPR